jgi:hypothetical protein
LSQTLQRRFVLYVSGTQAQADGHVQTISAWMEQAGIERAVGRYGQARGWSRQQLQAFGGFTVAAYGLDTAARGIKVQEYRPDLIILDDVDAEDDSPLVIKSKINAITLSILPTGSPDLAVLFVQNPMHEDSVWTQLHDGRAKFLLDRDVFEPEPAIRDLTYTSYQDEEGRTLWRITGGTPTWDGQPIAACERLMNLIGEQPFLREAQHKLDAGDRHYVFRREGVAYLRSLLPLLVEPDHEAETDWIEGHAEFYPEGRDDLAGYLEVWQRPERGHRYCIGADVAEGLQKEETDESTADVLDLETWEHVASYHGKPDPRSFAFDLYNLSEWYNRAQVIPENNSFGVEVVRNLEDLGANVWDNNPETETDGTEDTDQSAGMRTSVRTKGLVDAGLVSAITDAAKGRPSITLNSRRVVEQMIHYVFLPNRKRGGEGKWHDDHCVVAGTMIRTREGVKPVELVSVGDMVLTHTGAYRSVRATGARFAPTVMEIIVTGKPKLRITSDHPLMAFRQQWNTRDRTNTLYYSSSEWLALDQMENPLVCGLASVFSTAEEDVSFVDLLDTAPNTYREEDGFLVAYTYGGTRRNPKQNRIARFVRVDEDFCQLLGYYFAEGACGAHNLTFASHEKEWFLREWLKTYLGDMGFNLCERRTSDHGYAVSVGSVLLRAFFKTFGAREEKAFPVWVSNLPVQKQKQVLIGYLLGDGCFLDGRIAANTISASAAFQLHEMFLRCGWAVTLKHQSNQGRWEIQAGSPVANEIKSEILPHFLSAKNFKNTTTRRKQTNQKFCNAGDYLIGRIESITSVPHNDMVYNLSVEGDESYMANGIVVHNCRSIGLAWYVAKDYGLRPPPEPQKVGGNVYGGLYRGRGR